MTTGKSKATTVSQRDVRSPKRTRYATSDDIPATSRSSPTRIAMYCRSQVGVTRRGPGSAVGTRERSSRGTLGPGVTRAGAVPVIGWRRIFSVTTGARRARAPAGSSLDNGPSVTRGTHSLLPPFRPQADTLAHRPVPYACILGYRNRADTEQLDTPSSGATPRDASTRLMLPLGVAQVHAHHHRKCSSVYQGRRLPKGT